MRDNTVQYRTVLYSIFDVQTFSLSGHGPVCMDWVLGRVVEQSHCGASVGNTEITDLVFANDAVIWQVTGGSTVLVMTLEALHKEVKPLGRFPGPRPKFRCFKTYWMKPYSLSMCVARTLRSWKTSHTLTVYRLTMLGQARKLYSGLTWSTVLWTHLAQVFGVVGTCADGQRF